MAKYIVVHSIKVAKDFTPETFGRLTTIGPRFKMRESRKGNYRWYQVCNCACGCYTVTQVRYVIRGHTVSCGCLKIQKSTTHGMSQTAIYKQWAGMRKRCNNKNDPEYAIYGGRGISVHPDWDNTNNGFQNFYNYIGPKPTPKHSVDRYPNKDGNYEPGNVRWATMKEQQRNRRDNVNLTYNGKTMCVAAWAEEIGVQVNTLWTRLKAGWDTDKVIETPIRKRAKPSDKKA